MIFFRKISIATDGRPACRMLRRWGFGGPCRRGLDRATGGAGGYAVRSNFRGLEEAGGWPLRRTETEGSE